LNAGSRCQRRLRTHAPKKRRAAPKAKDTRLNRPVALKFISASHLADPARRARFIREARAASGLNHPNIIVVHEIETVGHENFIAMEFVPGRTLRERIGRKGLPLADAGRTQPLN
jgi:serine/threonine protein kinase